MPSDLFSVLLLFLGAIVAAVLFISDRTSRRLASSLPADVLPLFMGLLALAETLAKTTPTLEDDQLIARIKAALEPAKPPAPEPPTVTEITEGAQG
jgi:hypothetical protein